MKDVIDNYRDLPIGKWAEIQAICEQTDRDELDRQVAVIALLADMTDDEVLALPLPDYKAGVAEASFLTRPLDDMTPRAARQYVCEPFVLVPVTDIRKVTTAQYIDFLEYRKKGDSAVVELLSTLLVPKGCKYLDGYDIAQVQQAIASRMSTYDAMTLLAFFFSKSAELLQHFLTYSETEAAKMPEGPTKTEVTAKLAQIRASLSMTAGDGLRM
jgi:hypothetical protein